METTLVIMAAGIGSRFGKRIKQLEPVGEHGGLLLEYSVCDAAAAGFENVIFIIRRDIEDKFAPLCAAYAEKYHISVKYVFQDIDDLPVKVNVQREKPWGTGHALLAARKVLKTPFAVINSDDFYGRDAFEKAHGFLTAPPESGKEFDICMIGYRLKNSISDKGSVTRGICEMEKGILTNITETYDVAVRDGVITGRPKKGEFIEIDGNSLVSMNMWGFPPAIIAKLNEMFVKFLNENADDPLSEFLLPNAAADLMKEDKARITVLPSAEISFGMTREEDIEDVKARIKQLAAGRYNI